MALPYVSKGSGLPVVLLHAFPMDGRMWLPQAAALSDEFRIIVPDQRGFGQAADLAAGMEEISINRAAHDVAELLDELGVEKAVIGGISRGAYVAMAFSRRHVDRLHALMLFDTRATPETDGGKKNWADMAQRLETEGISFLPDVMRDRLWGKTGQSEQPELIARMNEVILSQQPEVVAAAARGMATRDDSRPGLASIQVPALVVAGEEDGAFAETAAIAEAISGARFVPVPRAGHLVNVEKPEEVTLVLRQFLHTV